ncbi:serine protease [Aureimonas leprariae]|uniref:Trypsin-like serine protease n=1 Tax=Plantimonas leprariae TaxID=2615207 RepID=A0A7V7TY09_9HYPH|nr:serine protease [Aureimonas leprariae]KAB0682680.1 trypsin-like serine protease [Aureimonas leprariae]
MLRAVQALATALLVAAAPMALGQSTAAASELSDAYNHQTDRNFRVGMQMRLAWTGDYKGGFSGAIDPASLRAIRDFQARHGMEASGVIDEAFLKLLVSESDRAQQGVGFRLVDDTVTGARVALPLDLVSDNGRTPIGRVWRSADRSVEVETVRLTGTDETLDGLYATLSHPTASRSVDAATRSEDGFSVSGTEAGRKYVMRFKGVDGDVRGFGVSFDAAAGASILPYAVVAANLFDLSIPANGSEIVAAADTGIGQVPETAAAVAPKHRLSALFESRVKSEEERPNKEKADSSGSGFAVSSDGWVLTNAHVAGSCRTVMVGDKGIADRVVVDEANDLAAVHVGATFAKPLRLAAGTPRLGEDVLALGFPLRSILADSLNVTRGNVSSLLGLQNDPRYLQISAPVQPGNSGGPLVDLSGRVVGVVTAKLDAMAVADATGDIPQSINFAIRPDAASAFLAKNGIDFASAPASKTFGSVADTTETVQDAVMPVLCLAAK